MQQQTLTGAPFSIVKPQSFYTIKGVKLQDGTYGAIQFTDHLLDNGKPHTLQQWAGYRERTGWGPGSAPLVTALFTALFDNKGHEGVEEVRNLFADDFMILMMTATGLIYRPEASDLVMHDAETPEQHTLEAHLVGPNSYVNAGMADLTQALFGNSDASKVRDAYKWVTGREPYLSRLNKQPEQNQKLALVLGGSLSDLGIYADIIDNGKAARGMRIAPQNSTGSKGVN